jgi:hypothetical protein
MMNRLMTPARGAHSTLHARYRAVPNARCRDDAGDSSSFGAACSIRDSSSRRRGSPDAQVVPDSAT